MPPQVTSTVSPSSAEPVIWTPAAASPASTMLSPVTASTVAAEGGVTSTATAVEPAALVLPAASVAVAVISVAGSDWPAGNWAVQLPFASAVVWAVSAPQVTSTVLFGSAVPLPVTPAATAAAFTVPTALSTGASGGVVSTTGVTVSTVTSRVASALVLPAASVAVALIVLGPSAGSSPGSKVTDQEPSSAAVVSLTTSPQVTTTVLPASAVPLTTTSAAASFASTRLSPATALMVGASGAVSSGGVWPPPPP